jgi:peptidylprolyl isomerase
MAGPRPETAPVGKILEVKDGLASVLVVSDLQKSVAGVSLPKTTNPALKHDGPGVLGMSYENRFYLTLKKVPGLDDKYPAIGRLVAGAGILAKLKKDDPVRSVRIIRVGQAAREFKTDNASFKKLLENVR